MNYWLSRHTLVFGGRFGSKQAINNSLGVAPVWFSHVLILFSLFLISLVCLVPRLQPGSVWCQVAVCAAGLSSASESYEQTGAYKPCGVQLPTEWGSCRWRGGCGWRALCVSAKSRLGREERHCAKLEFPRRFKFAGTHKWCGVESSQILQWKSYLSL